MSRTQQEAYQVIFKNTPQKLYQVFRMLSMLKQAAKSKEMKRQADAARQDDWQNFKQLREQLGLPESPELKGKFLQLPNEKRRELIRDCEKKLLLQAGEKDFQFLMESNKMLAQPQILNKEVNIDQLKKMMTEYGLQFHIKDLPDHTKELHFFAKDANIAARAIDRTIDSIVNDPTAVTKPTLEQLIKEAQSKVQDEKLQKQEAKEVGLGESKNVTESATESKETLETLSLFEELKDGIEL
ncbi:hypothetical protein [Enterococcus faecium]|uniref:hypothetical protein n=1 Tax=Enterococcus faecium TaxID=1352 RepID=UPI000812E10A|nr:hypothetical protein [Enterococcus faecium]